MKKEEPAVGGGRSVRTKPLPLEFPGVHYMDNREVRAVVRVMRARSPFRYYSIDPRKEKEVDKLEIEFARFVGAKHALAVTSGTGALHVALSALGVGPGQEVIVPAYMWVSVIAAIVNLGAIPVVADINHTFGMDPVALSKRITSKTKGIIAVRMSGAPCDIESIAKVARKHKLWVLEDCAQYNGGSVHKRKVRTNLSK
jgi:dTDP-4-amino-4,6-dideoxygalactose transaminase